MSAKISYWQRQNLKRKAEREKRSLRQARKREVTREQARQPVANQVSAAPPAVEINPRLHWVAVRTNIKCEERAKLGLEAAHIACYMPTMKKERVFRGKRISRDIPILSRYIFAGLSPQDLAYGVLRETDGVESILGIEGEPIRIKGEHLIEFDAYLKEMAAAEAKPITFAIGDQVKITDGVLQGLPAVIDVMMQTEAQVSVNIFGRATKANMRLDALVHL